MEHSDPNLSLSLNYNNVDVDVDFEFIKKYDVPHEILKLKQASFEIFGFNNSQNNNFMLDKFMADLEKMNIYENYKVSNSKNISALIFKDLKNKNYIDLIKTYGK